MYQLETAMQWEMVPLKFGIYGPQPFGYTHPGEFDPLS